MKHFLCLIAGFLLVNNLNAQTTLRGSVADYETGHPLIGASVLHNDSKIGTKTDEHGNFEIQVTEPSGSILYISYVGYRSVSVELATAVSQTIEVNLSKSLFVK